jgi:hypothetical protein
MARGQRGDEMRKLVTGVVIERVLVGEGNPCPECAYERKPGQPEVIMQRYRHPDNFVPPPFTPYYQAQWDVRGGCRHVSHHKHLRRPTPNYRSQPPYLKRNKENPAPLPGRIIPPKFTGSTIGRTK